MARQTFSSTDDYLIEVETTEEECHVHCLVYTWNKSVLNTLYREFVELRQHVREMGYDQMVSVSPNPKFCRLFGAESLGEYRENKEDYEVMVWDLVR